MLSAHVFENVRGSMVLLNHCPVLCPAMLLKWRHSMEAKLKALCNPAGRGNINTVPLVLQKHG